jgi:hypothetical protein
VAYVPSNANRTTPKNAAVDALNIVEESGFIWAVPADYPEGARMPAVGPGGCCPPRHPVPLDTSEFE